MDCHPILSVIILVINKSDSHFMLIKFFSSLVWLQTKLDSTQSYYHCILSPPKPHVHIVRIKEMIVKQILLVTTLGNVKRKIRRLFVLMLACKGSNICLSDKEVTNLNVVYFILTVPFSRWLSKTVSFKVIAICYIPFLAGANIRAKVCFSRDLNWLTFLHLMKKKFHTISNEKYFVADQYQYWKGFFFFFFLTLEPLRVIGF